MAGGYNTSVNQTRNNNYSYNPNTNPNTNVQDGSNRFNYSEVYNSAEPESSAVATRNKNPNNSAVGPWGITMGQTQNFTFYINGICEADNAFVLTSKNGRFLPLKQMEYKQVSLEHLKIKAGVFSDLPFFHRRKMSTISCTILDSSKSLIVQRLFQWYNSCVHQSGWVPYIDDMCKEAEYIEYTHDGKIALKYGFSVIPEGDISVTRQYEGEALTEYRFQLIIVSGISARGNNGEWIEADWGDGPTEGADYERRVSWKINVNGQQMVFTDPAIADYVGKR